MRRAAASVRSRSPRRSLLALVAAGAARRRAAARRDRAPSALVVEASTGDVAYDRRPTAAARSRSTTKLMTALLTLERAKPRRVFRAVALPRAAGRVEDQPAAGRADDGRRPAARRC